ncbi:MAG: 3-phosphoserine/phosphohydroxythreonine transaminase [Bacteroidales bacterium]|nr:3-phosphoserine/phosphohydroxythreonine transaminase [Bacteroidales bacterium]
MKKVHNFNAGPCVLPKPAINAAIEALKDFKGSGMSVIEISHRSKDWEAVMTESEALWKELLNIPDGYRVLFLGGGASTQFCYVPFNLMNKKAAYLETGVWANKALKEAKYFGEVAIVASSKESVYNHIPKGFTIPTDADYFHITTNNTIYGTEIKEDMNSPIPLVADMSSDIMSRPVDVSKYALIYGGAQKNVGPAGVTFVIVKESALGKVERPIPTMVDYRTHIKEGSMFNTPPVFSILVMNETLKWVKSLGGLKVMQKLNQEKAAILYDEIDRNKMFKGTIVDKADRSLMNICFVMNDEYKDKEEEFMNVAKANGMVGIKGHRSVGGFRASTYNACPKESIQALVDCMKEFEAKNAK